MSDNPDSSLEAPTAVESDRPPIYEGVVDQGDAPANSDLRSPEAIAEQVGNPDYLSQFWEQQPGPVDCGVTSQEAVLSAYGLEYSTKDLQDIGIQEGAFDPDPVHGGTNDLGYAFDNVGLGRNFETSNNAEEAVDKLHTELEADHAVIAGVDAGVLWQDPQYAGHAVWVTGIDYNSDGSIGKVYTNDSGRPDGQMAEYDGKVFMEAWERMDYEMVSTQTPFPELNEQ